MEFKNTAELELYNQSCTRKIYVIMDGLQWMVYEIL